MNSDFYCLLEDCSNSNLLINAFDIQFSFVLKNKFYRNVDGKGCVYKRKKYSFFLRGKGELSNFFDDSNLKFFSSRFVLQSDLHSFFCLLKENDSSQENQKRFEERWKQASEDCQWTIPLVENKKNFGFPILDVCLVKKFINEKNWTLELIEK
ncbi:hypothetical protein [Alphaproteobacteria bacterium endosymbiont of Tiliacea citrago]|uniref:hypothetical protein n=1 Tax=Alphaproteobacteria bacterium endosymbiont of Tiliacea citrago TaxID=3077944 RepID=UPI00313AC83E